MYYVQDGENNMKVEFAVEKSMYSNLLMELMSGKEDVNVAAILIKLKTIEEIIKAHDDEIITVVSTQKTYDGPAAAAPMSEEKWNKEKEVENTMEECPKCGLKELDITDGVCDYCGFEKPVPPTEKVVIVPSPQCTKCKHKMVSHKRRGCRFCECKEPRKK